MIENPGILPMKMGDNVKKCVVRGEAVEFPGSRDELVRGRYVDGKRKTVDGVNTDAGLICSDCLAVYDRADRQYLLDNSIKSDKRSFLKSRLKDPDYITESLRENARMEVDRVLSDIDEGRGWYEKIKELKEILVKGIKVSSYSRMQDGKIVEGLELHRAFGCFMEEKRTMKFIQGLYLAMERLEAAKGRFELVDAGCGPLPVFGIIAALKSENVNVTCLEINESSAKMAETVIENLGLQGRVKILRVDATTYEHPKPIDLLISETMYAGLTEEPQVQILRNLERQVVTDGIIIPELISVEAGLVKEGDFPEGLESSAIPPEQKVQLLRYSIDPETVSTFTRGKLAETIDISLPVDELVGEFRLVLSSKVGIYGEIGLSGGESIITAPAIVSARVRIHDGARAVKARYTPGTDLERVLPEVE